MSTVEAQPRLKPGDKVYHRYSRSTYATVSKVYRPTKSRPNYRYQVVFDKTGETGGPYIESNLYKYAEGSPPIEIVFK